MSICDGCIHDEVCGLEDNHEEGIVSCADMIPKDVLNKIRAEINDIEEGISSYHNDRPWIFKDEVLDIIDRYKERSE